MLADQRSASAGELPRASALVASLRRAAEVLCGDLGAVQAENEEAAHDKPGVLCPRASDTAGGRGLHRGHLGGGRASYDAMTLDALRTGLRQREEWRPA